MTKRRLTELRRFIKGLNDDEIRGLIKLMKDESIIYSKDIFTESELIEYITEQVDGEPELQGYSIANLSIEQLLDYCSVVDIDELAERVFVYQEEGHSDTIIDYLQFDTSQFLKDQELLETN